MEHSIRTVQQAIARIMALVSLCVVPAVAQQAAPPGGPVYGNDELISTGHLFFGTASRSLANVIEKAVGQWGQPNGYILGQEGGGAFVAGLRYGEGRLYRMPVTCGSTGRAPRSGSTGAATAPAP